MSVQTQPLPYVSFKIVWAMELLDLFLLVVV